MSLCISNGGSFLLQVLENVRNHRRGFNAGDDFDLTSAAFADLNIDLEHALEALQVMARVIAKVNHSHCSGLPLQADLDEKIYKLLFLDVGLMNAICGLDWRVLSGMEDVQLTNEGAIAEQFIGQHLQSLLASAPNRGLTYWLRERKSSNAELDFVIALDGRILPIEVKAGSTGRMRSLHQFMGEKNAPLAVRLILMCLLFKQLTQRSKRHRAQRKSLTNCFRYLCILSSGSLSWCVK